MTIKKCSTATFFFIIVTNIIYAQSDTGVHFVQGLSWEQVKEKAKAENKYIFVDCYASWCAPCKWMDKNVYPKENVGNFINEHFVSLKAQMDTSKQDDDYTKQLYVDAHFLMQEYKINEFPYLLFFSPDGRIVHKAVGARDEGGLIFLSKNAMDPNKQFCTLVEKFKENNLDTSYMKALARDADALEEKDLARKIAYDYINQLSEIQLYQVENIWLMVDFTTSSKERGFVVFRDHADKIHQADSTISETGPKAFVENIIYNEEMKSYISSRNGKPDWAKMKTNVKKYGILGEETLSTYRPRILFKTEIEPELKIDPDWKKVFVLIKKQNVGQGEEFLVGSSIVYYLNDGLLAGKSKKYKNFLDAATLYFNKYNSYLRPEVLNDWAWALFESCDNRNVLNTALAWSDSCLKKSPAPLANYYDTYANLLFKIGRNQEAIPWEEKAVNLAPNDKGIQDSFLKMKKGIPTWENN